MDKKDKILGIKSITLVGTKSRTSNSYGRNLPYMRYRVFLNKLDENNEPYQIELSNVFTDEELKDLSYWSNRSLSMSMTCWGTSQLFEAQISLGSFLGWNSKDWSKFSRQCTDFITVLN